MKIRIPPRNEANFARISSPVRPTERDLDALLHEDFFWGARTLLRGLVLVLRRESVPTRVAHDRVRGDHRPARGARDLAGLPLRRLLWKPVPTRVAHDRVRGDHRPARGARDLAGLPLRLHLRGLGFRLGGRPDGLGHRTGDGLRRGLWTHWRRSERDLGPHAGGGSGRGLCGRSGDDRGFRGRRGPHVLLSGEESLLPLREPPLILRDLRLRGCDGVLLLREPLLPAQQLGPPLNLGFDCGLLLAQELEDVLLSRGDLPLAGGDLLAGRGDLRVPAVELFLPFHEGLHPAGHILLPPEDVLLLREGLLLRGLELLLPLREAPVLLLELLLPGPHPLLPPDEAVPLLREGGALLLQGLAVRVELPLRLREVGLPLREVLLLRLEGLLRLPQQVRDRRRSAHGGFRPRDALG